MINSLKLKTFVRLYLKIFLIEILIEIQIKDYHVVNLLLNTLGGNTLARMLQWIHTKKCEIVVLKASN